MRNTYDVRAVQSLPPRTGHQEIERIIESGFSSVTALVIAEASGNAPLSARAVLANAEHCETWLLALLQVKANLAHSMSGRYLELGAARVENDSSFQRQRRTRAAVASRVQEARKRVTEVRERLDRDMEATLPPVKRVRGMAGLREAHGDEWGPLLAQVAEESAVASEAMNPPPDAEHDPRWAARHGVIKEPATEAVQDLLWRPDSEFLERVGEDVREPSGRYSGLRHPLLLNRWGGALDELTDVTARRLGFGAGTELTHEIVERAWFDLPGDFNEARAYSKRLRFFEAIRIRQIEQEAATYALARQIRYGIERVRRNVTARAEDELRNRYLDELSLYAALTP